MSGNDPARRAVFRACGRLAGARRLRGMVLLQHDPDWLSVNLQDIEENTRNMFSV
jgi:hypothetical protein